MSRYIGTSVPRYYTSVLRYYGEGISTATDRSQITNRRSQIQEIRRLERIARLFDDVLRVPGVGWRFGLDGLIGLVPGLGDVIGGAVSGYIVYKFWRLGAPRRLLLRMIGNVALDVGGGAIPIAGDLFDLAFKVNRRNVKLLKRHLQETRSGEAAWHADGGAGAEVEDESA